MPQQVGSLFKPTWPRTASIPSDLRLLIFGVLLAVGLGLVIVASPAMTFLFLIPLGFASFFVLPQYLVAFAISVACVQTVSYYVQPLSYNFKPFEAFSILVIPLVFLTMLLRRDFRLPPLAFLFVLFLGVAALSYFYSPPIPITAGEIVGAMGKDSPPYRFYSRVLMLLFFFLVYWAFWYLFHRERLRIVALQSLFYSSVLMNGLAIIAFALKLAGVGLLDPLGLLLEG